MVVSQGERDARRDTISSPAGSVSSALTHDRATQGHAAREMRVTVRVRCGACARMVWVWVCGAARRNAAPGNKPPWDAI